MKLLTNLDYADNIASGGKDYNKVQFPLQQYQHRGKNNWYEDKHFKYQDTVSLCSTIGTNFNPS